MNTFFLNYANSKFFEAQANSVHCAEIAGFENIFPKRFEDIPWTFYLHYKEILNQDRGAGCCLWKPFFILDIMRHQMRFGDFLLYMDSSDGFKPGLLPYILNNLNIHGQFFVQNIFKNSVYTRRNCFKMMECDSQKYWEADQIEAGCVGLVKTSVNLEFVERWLYWCYEPEIMIDKGMEETGEGNFKEYKRHSCDQSVLTNLIVQWGVKTTSIRDVLPFIEYNKYG